jgi:four helix bundle protein
MFLDYARASCGEAGTQAIVGMKVGFITEEIGQAWCNETKQLASMINGLIRSIGRN